MSVKIKLGETPKTFKSIPVTFTLADGQEGVVNVVYKYRTRTDYAAFMEEVRQSAASAFGDSDGSLPSVHGVALESDADTVLGSVDSWDLDVDLVRADIKQLADQAPSIISAVATGYRRACVEGHLGN